MSARETVGAGDNTMDSEEKINWPEIKIVIENDLNECNEKCEILKGKRKSIEEEEMKVVEKIKRLKRELSFYEKTYS